MEFCLLLGGSIKVVISFDKSGIIKFILTFHIHPLIYRSVLKAEYSDLFCAGRVISTTKIIIIQLLSGSMVSNYVIFLVLGKFSLPEFPGISHFIELNICSVLEVGWILCWKVRTNVFCRINGSNLRSAVSITANVLNSNSQDKLIKSSLTLYFLISVSIQEM